MDTQTDLPFLSGTPVGASDGRAPELGVTIGSALPAVTLEISFEALLGKRASDISEAVRRTRWEEWKKLSPDGAEYWQPDAETCGTCKHLRGDWCALMELPAAVNPVISYRHGMTGLACMGGGHEPNAAGEPMPGTSDRKQ